MCSTTRKNEQHRAQTAKDQVHAPGHHTHAEIASQAEVWPVVLAGLGNAALPVPGAYDEVLIIGCGSTHYLAQWAARRCEELHGVRTLALPASELLAAPSAWLRERRTLLVVVSRSGETTESLRAVAAFRTRTTGEVLAVTCAPESALAQGADFTLATPAARERSIAQTRTFTSMMLAIATWLLGPADPAVRDALAGACRRTLEVAPGLVHALAADGVRRFFFLGASARYGLACEAMLKMTEMALAPAAAFHTLELRHGPMSLVDGHTAVIALLEEADGMEADVLADMVGLGARTVALAPAPVAAAQETLVLEGGVPPVWRDALYLPALQLLAYERAIQAGLDPDRPTNLDAVVVLED
jgi:glucosamine--fructose-6-phosphate aminotransferase (isomerizing)